MIYRIKKETKPHLPTYGKYKAVAVHHQTIEKEELLKAAAKNSVFDEATYEGVMTKLSIIIREYLRQGHSVRLRGLGLMKLEIESDKVDDPKEFRANKHIRGVRLHLIPESKDGSQPLYDGITFEKDKHHYQE